VEETFQNICIFLHFRLPFLPLLGLFYLAISTLATTFGESPLTHHLTPLSAPAKVNVALFRPMLLLFFYKRNEFVTIVLYAPRTSTTTPTAKLT